jgi:hypothetical protein
MHSTQLEEDDYHATMQAVIFTKLIIEIYCHHAHVLYTLLNTC